MNNRQRRADKKRHNRAGPTNTRPHPRQGDFDEDLTPLAEQLVAAAADAVVAGNEGSLDHLVRTVLTLPAHAGSGGTLAGWVLSGRLDRALRGAWNGGWQPLDVVLAVTRRLGDSHAGLAVTAIGSEARTSAGPGAAVPERWRAQLRQVGAAVWWDTTTCNYVDHWARREGLEPFSALTHGVELLAMLVYLPVLPCLMTPPGQWARAGRPHAGTRPIGVDGKVLAKVRALLAKAESTTFDDEAEALTAKAQQLMARYAIDQAMLHEASPDQGPSGDRV